MNVTRVLKDTPATVTLTTYRDGSQFDVGTITLTATKADGTALFSNQAVTDNNDGTYAFAFTATHTANLNFLTLVWTEAGGESYTTYVEIVGNHLFTEAEARAFDNQALGDASVYTDAAIAAERDRVTDLLETWTGVSWIPKFARKELAGDGTRDLWLPHHRIITVQSATISGTAQTVANITVDKPNGRLFHESSTWTAPTSTNRLNCVIEYEHGYEQLRDGVDRIALILLRNRIVASNITDRATTVQYDDGVSVRFAGGPSGIPEVNDWIRDHDERLPVG